MHTWGAVWVGGMWLILRTVYGEGCASRGVQGGGGGCGGGRSAPIADGAPAATNVISFADRRNRRGKHAG
ncbi:hypothetical protein GCM10010182_07340 [Actinomadura cremea]|nr:hypothetical protein GCM10010182_07340 [Actinomadura cremea]